MDMLIYYNCLIRCKGLDMIHDEGKYLKYILIQYFMYKSI